MPGGWTSHQYLSLQVEERAELEVCPELTIPFPENDPRQHIEAKLHPAAVFTMADMVHGSGRAG
ncbi:MAG: urease accessory protein UreD [Truepera sp.]|nr:urease accessory protein UreD [Truepera sp.]